MTFHETSDKIPETTNYSCDLVLNLSVFRATQKYPEFGISFFICQQIPGYQGRFQNSRFSRVSRNPDSIPTLARDFDVYTR